MSQLSAFEVELAVDEPAELPLAWKDPVVTDLQAILSRVPQVGHAKGTYREHVRRPVGYLYFRPDLLELDERNRCFERAERSTGANSRINFLLSPAAGQVKVTGVPGTEIYSGKRLLRDDGVLFHTDTIDEGNGWPEAIDDNGEAWVDVIAMTSDVRAETAAGELLTFLDVPLGADRTATVGERGIKQYLHGPIATRRGSARAGGGWWVRLNGEPARTGREALLPCAQADHEVPYMLAIRWTPWLHGDSVKITRDFASSVTKAALAVGCRVRARKGKGPSPIYANNLAQLVLALHWSPVLAHAAWWTVLGIELKSDDWLVAVDHACHLGRPWSEAMAKLTARPESDAIIRALRWLYTNKGNR